ncbi:VanW family protein [Paenibacillus sp.]|uniref:VanW family protein n=1 Tax=Paenibacillus sp. TaxID=58172 RepID=UPI002D2F52F9|nr:VanW family protein [Paenibacillus sp.]HZG87423.1 VanW family protein [Paenibacillus sp.]
MNSRLIRWILIGWGIGLAAAGIVAWYGMHSGLPGGMSVSGWNVGGMRTDEFEKGLADRVAQLARMPVAMTAPMPGGGTETRTATLGTLGLQTNADQLRAEIGRFAEGSVWERAWRRWQWHGRSWELRVAFDAKALSAAAQQTWPELYASRPVNAVRSITEQDEVRYSPERKALRLDEKGLTSTIWTAVLGEGGAAAAKAGRAAHPYALKPDGPLQSKTPLKLTVPTYELQPEVTVAMLKEQGVERLISSFTTSFATSGSGRRHNVAKTASVVHNRLLKPGDVFDYAKIIEETESKFGFREAPVILNGKLCPGVGGGICQVSTTLYNAVLRAGLEIVERRNHSLPVSYAPIGQDATFASGYINFKFRNNTEKYILIRTSTENGKLTVKLFGSMPPGVAYEIKSVKLEELDPPTKYVKNPHLRKGSVELLQRGKPGYVVVTHRYKKVNGKVVDKELISKDTYKPLPTLYASNSGDASDREQERHRGDPIVEDGVKAPAD